MGEQAEAALSPRGALEDHGGEDSKRAGPGSAAGLVAFGRA